MRAIHPPPTADDARPTRPAIDATRHDRRRCNRRRANGPHAEPQAAQASDSSPQPAIGIGASTSAATPREMAQDMMARMGISPELQANMNASLQSNLKSFD